MTDPGTRTRTGGGAVRWHMPADLRGLLLGPVGLPLSDWLRDGSATVVKDAPHRAVHRLRLPGLDCHVKHYRLLGWRSRVRELLRPVKARREHAIAAELMARGVPVPRPLAWGVEGTGYGPAASWLVTETVPDTVPLLTYLDTTLPALAPAENARARQRLARAVGSFLASLHAAGVIHHDLHPGNLLVQFGSAGEPRLWLIDLHAVALGPPRLWPTRRANLVVFNRFFALRASRSDRLRCWRAYRAAAGTAVEPPSPVEVRELELATDRSNRSFWRARDARCLRTNRYYRRITAGTVRGHAVRDLDPAAAGALAADPDGPFRRPGTRVLKDSRSSTVAEFDLPVNGQPCRLIYKRFRLTDRRDPWLGLVRQTAALRSWVFGHGLRERCLPTARPLAVFHRTRGGTVREGYLLTEKIDGAIDLRGFVNRLAALPAAERTPELRARLEALARVVRQLHDRSLSHRDLKAPNVLTAMSAGDARFWFIDLVGVRRHRRVGRRRKAKDLARLHASFMAHPLVSRTEKLRFLLAYRRAGLIGRGGWKDWWQAIAAATGAKLAKNVRTGRPLA